MKVRRIDFAADEWLAGTVELTLQEEGLYWRICSLIYSRGGPITYELLARACRNDHGNRVRACLENLVALGKVTRNGSEIDQKRCENELKNARIRVGKARENGAKGGRPNGLAKPDGCSPSKANYQLSTINNQFTEETSVSSGATAPVPDPTADMWRRGRAALGKTSGGMIGRALKEHGDDAVVSAILACEREMPVEPVEFFMGCLRHRSRKLTAVGKLYAGAMEAADDYDREQQQRNGGAGKPALVPLLDSGRS